MSDTESMISTMNDIETSSTDGQARVRAVKTSMEQKEADSIDYLMEQVRKGYMVTVPIDLTPELAKELLVNAKPNRKLCVSEVNRMAKLMTEGKWLPYSHPSLAVTPDGRLCDGNHRTHGVVKSGVTIKTTITYNLPEDAVIDRGRTRSLADTLSIRHGEAISSAIASAIKIAMIGPHQTNYAYTNISDEDVSAFYEKHQAMVDFARSLHKTSKGIPSSVVLAVCIRAGYYEDLNAIKRFWYALHTGEINSMDENVVLRLRKTLQDKTKASKAEKYAYIEAGLKAFCLGKDLKRITPASHELYPFLDEEPGKPIVRAEKVKTMS